MLGVLFFTGSSGRTGRVCNVLPFISDDERQRTQLESCLDTRKMRIQLDEAKIPTAAWRGGLTVPGSVCFRLAIILGFERRDLIKLAESPEHRGCGFSLMYGF